MRNKYDIKNIPSYKLRKALKKMVCVNIYEDISQIVMGEIGKTLFLQEKRWIEAHKNANPNAYPLDPTNQKVWSRYGINHIFTIEYLEDGNLVLNVTACQRGETYRNGVEWEMVFKCSPQFINHIKKYIVQNLYTIEYQKMESRLQKQFDKDVRNRVLQKL